MQVVLNEDDWYKFLDVIRLDRYRIRRLYKPIGMGYWEIENGKIKKLLELDYKSNEMRIDIIKDF